MTNLSYNKNGLVLERGSRRATDKLVRDLQHDLRSLGYLNSGIDGSFGTGTEVAVKALRYDLLHNAGSSSQADGNAPVRMIDYNRGRVVDINGTVDQPLAACISDMLDDQALPKLPYALNPLLENKKLVEILKTMSSQAVPVPFLLAILTQESGLKHYNEPPKGDDDCYIVVGLDTNAGEKHIITSRGYGAGQYTLFHHPPRFDEVNDFMLDVKKNVQKTMAELRSKFDGFVLGNSTGTRSDDRVAEIGTGPLVECKYDKSDSRFMRDCSACTANAGTIDITDGKTPLFPGSKYYYVPTQYYKTATYRGVPVREKIGCDWPYAVRRYNGAGINSYHYQARVLKNLLSV
jgi:hypothetical protein